MSLRLTKFLSRLSTYIDVSSEMQVGAIEFACTQGGRIDIKLFCQFYGLKYKQALDLMGRLHRKGLVRKADTGVYVLTEKGREVCTLISSVDLPLTLRTIKLLMTLGTKLSGRLTLREALKRCRCSKDELLRDLTGLAEVKRIDGEEVLVLNEDGEQFFRELVEAVGLGPNIARILSILTRTSNPLTALGRFMVMHLGISVLILYEVFTAPILGTGAALLWMTITLIMAALLIFRK